METGGLTSDFLGVTKGQIAPSDWAGYSRFFQDDEIVLNKFDSIIFKVFDRIFYQAPFPAKAFMVVFGIMHVQALYGNTFFSLDPLYNTVVKIVEITTTDGMSPAQFNEFGYSFFGLTLITWILFITVSVILYKQKYISTIPLIATSIFIYLINPLLLNPTTYLIKRLIILLLMMASYWKNPNNPVHTNFLKYYRNEDFIYYRDEITKTDRNLLILLLVFLIIALILQTVMILLSFRLLSATPNIPYHALSGLSMTCIFYQTFLRPIIRLLESFFGFYPRWSTIVLYASNIVLYLLLLYFIFLYPVIHSVTISLMIGFSIGGAVGSILKLTYAQVLDGMKTIHYALILASYFVSSLIAFLVLHFSTKKKYVPLLAYNGEANIVDTPNDKRSSLLNMSTAQKDDLIRKRVSEDERLQIIPYSKKISFSFVRIISRMKLLFLVKIGFENGCDLFIDYTLFKFIISSFSEDRELLKLISIIEMAFPYMRNYFQYILPIIRSDVMKFNQRFLIYEINTLNKLTETNPSISSTQELGLVRSNSIKYQEIVMNTWLLDQISLSSLENVMSTVRKGDKMWNWIFTKYPNLKEAHRLYYNYSVECKTDFFQAEITKRQIKRIEDHKLTIRDKPFVSFIRTFPVYLTHGIITPNGFLPDFSNNDTQYKEEPSDGSIDNISSFNEPTDYDAKLRYAIYKATYKLSAFSSFFMQIIICAFFFIFVVAEFALTFVYYTNFNTEMENTDILRFYRHLASNISLTNAYILLKYGTIYTNTTTNFTNSNSSLCDSTLLEDVASYRFNFFDYYDRYNQSQMYFETSEDTLNYNIITQALMSVQSYQMLFNEFKHLNLQDYFDFHDVEQLMFFTQFPMQLCNGGKKMNPLMLDFSRSLMDHTINQVDISCRQNMENWLNKSNSFCNIFSTFAPLMNTIKEIRYKTYSIFMETNRLKRREIILISILLSVIISAVYMVFFIIGVFRYKKELRCFAEILSSLDEEVKKNGSRPILIQTTANQNNGTTNNTGTNNNNNNNISEKNINPMKYVSKKVFYYSLLILCIFFILIQGVLLFSIGYISYQMKSYDLTITYWNYYNMLKIPQYLELFDSLSLACILRTHPTNSTTYQFERDRCFSIIEETDQSDTYLVTSGSDGPTILGRSEKFDDYYLKSTCVYNFTADQLSKRRITHPLESNNNTNSTDDDPFDWLDDQSIMYSDEEYECMSLSNKMLIFIQITRDVLQKLGKDITTYSLNDYIVSRIAYLYYIMNKYLINDINVCNMLIIELGNKYLSESKRNIILMFVASIILSIVSFFVSYYFKNFMDSIYQGGLILARRLIPNEMAANHRLVSFLLNKGINKKNINKEMSVTQSIVHYSSDMLFFTTNNGIILLTNQAIFQNLSYSPEQIVGKLIYSLFEEESKKEIQRQIAILEKDQNQGMVHLNVTCYTANGGQLYVSMMMFPTSSNHLVFIMKNLTDILEKQRIAQQMRNNCLGLYFNILPTFVAKLLNNEEKDISFMVPTATIMYVDIAHFAEFARPLSPEQLLGLLSSIYDQYDVKLREYSSLTKIKIIGDSLMVAGGLFNNQLDYNKVIPASSSNMNSAVGGITQQKSRDHSDKVPKVPIIGGPTVLGFSKSIDIIPPSLSTFSSQGSMGGPHTERYPVHNEASPHSDQDGNVQIYPSYSDIENALQFQEQIISQSSNSRMESDYMTPDAFVASQAIRFGFDCIEVIEDIDMKNNYNLAVRVGISTGGPIIAGVLGEDKLDFEIFGEEISFTSKLETCGLPGRVVISDSTYNLVSNLQYQFEDRDIFFKGKGNIRTHIVNPA